MGSGVAAVVPLEVYLRTSYEPDCEWVDGEIRERNVGEGQHAVIQKWLAMFFGMREEAWRVLALTEMRVRTSPSHYRIPDFCVMPDSWHFEAIARTPPLLCVEILPREDRMTEMYEKVDDYLRMGVAAVWIIDPRRRKTLCTDAKGTLAPVVAELLVEGTPIRLEVSELFKQLNRLEGVK